MAHRFHPDRKDVESIYEAMVAALARRDLVTLESLLADEIEFRSYAIGGAGVIHGKQQVLAAVRATRNRVYDPTLLAYEHLGGGWLIASGRLRHTSDETGGLTDGRKAALAQVTSTEVRVSIATPSVEEARAEYGRRHVADAEASTLDGAPRA